VFCVLADAEQERRLPLVQRASDELELLGSAYPEREKEDKRG
jgi:hypothetical protein